MTSVEASKALKEQWDRVKQSKSLAEEITEWQKCCELVRLKEKIVEKAIVDAKEFEL